MDIIEWENRYFVIYRVLRIPDKYKAIPLIFLMKLSVR